MSYRLAGKAADKGWTRGATAVAMLASSCSFILSHFLHAGSIGALIGLALSAILLDAGITANLVLGQREIFALEAQYRSRLNGLYIATIFVGGACGSALGGWSYAHGGWQLTSRIGFLMPATALLYFFTEKKSVVANQITLPH